MQTRDRTVRRAGVKYCEVSKYRVRSYDEERGARASARPGAGRRAGRTAAGARAVARGDYPWRPGSADGHQRHTAVVRVITAPRAPPAAPARPRPRPALLSFGRWARAAR